MKLLSTQIVGNSMELTYADDPQTDAATKLLQVRLPMNDPDPKKSLAWHRYWFLKQLQDELEPLVEEERKIVSRNV